MSQFHLLPGQPCHHTLKKGILSPLYSPAPIPPFNMSVPRLFHIFSYPPHASSQGKMIALISCRPPFFDVNTSIPEDRPRGPCILVSSTSLMSSNAFWVGCVSHARLQLHYCTVEIRIGYWFLHYLVKDPSCHLTLEHW